jgi:fructose-1,6-bisphosphatase/inositol monophosphatase family enzyme
VPVGNDLDVDDVSELLRDVAARLIVPRFRALTDQDVRQKAHGEAVTVADVETEQEITAALAVMLPDAPVLGEEAAADDPTMADRVLRTPRYWVLDPLDGTSNFIAGRPDVGTMLALVEQGVTVAAWIWQPLHQEMYVAELGSGAYRNGVRLARHAVAPWDPGAIVAYTHTAFLDRVTARRVDEAAASAGFGDVTAGPRAACITYPRLALGSVGFALYGRTHPWDHAAGALLVAETGGTARRFNGTPYSPAQTGRGLLVSAHQEEWSRIASALGVAELDLR